jgi:outer membrane protein assembly factor BamB
VNLNISLAEDKGPFKYIYSIAEDKGDEYGNKNIWLGTDKGLKYYKRPSALLNDPNILPEPVYVTKDSLTELLLSGESIRCLKIDGGNRKWVGTDNSGVYLLSAECDEEIFHFTTENSPLLSNTIHSIEIDGESGEVYFGTENGLISFRYTATDPKEQYEELKIFPNPVRETFNGYISIEGLKEKSEVKITDAQGGIVYRTVSNGGTAVWDGKRFDGQKAATGVYFVFVSDEYGEERIAGKILFIK